MFIKKLILKVGSKAIFFICLAVVVLLLCSAQIFYAKRKSAHYPVQTHVIVIDAGHGGIDGGVSGVLTDIPESEINLAIAKKLRDIFVNNGFKVVLTRETSAGLYGHTGPGHKKRDMAAREKIIKGANPALVISIHQNTFSNKALRGAQVFYKAGYEEGKEFASHIQERLNLLEENARKNVPLSGDYFIVNVSPCPAVIVECGFLSNEQDERLLISEKYQNTLAQTIFIGSMNYLVGV